MIAVIVAGITALIGSLVLTPLFARLAHKIGWGQYVRADGPQTHATKRGTPTMGGVVFLAVAVLSYFFANFITSSQVTASGLLVLLMSLGCALIGFIDDYLKVRKEQSLGLGGWSKIVMQIVVAVLFGLLALSFVNDRGLTPASSAVSAFRDTGFDFMHLGPVIGFICFILWIALITTATSNSVNLTDGLDGLAAGSSVLVFLAYLLISFWQFRQSCAFVGDVAGCYEVRDPLDLAVIAAAFVGATIGFLWWNTSPALLFMGDTGSMGIGGAIAAFAILTRTELLLIVLGGLFLAESGSVILQRIYFKVTKGKRIFLMSPFHHHFEMKGWQQVTVVVRLWIVTGILVVIGVAMFYAEWVVVHG